MSNRADLLALVEALSGARVLCVGDVILDHFQYGTVERISPEAPVPVLMLDAEESSSLGGAGNVVRNLRSMGAEAEFVTVIGAKSPDEADLPGQEVRKLVEEQGVASDAVLLDVERRTSTKTRYLADGQQILRADRETAFPLGEAIREELLERTKAAMDHCSVVVLSDYGKGVLGEEVTATLIEAARAAGKFVIVDPKGNDYERYRGASLITPNRKELAEASRMPVDGEDEVRVAADWLIAEHGLGAVLATLGADGMTLVTTSGDVIHLAAEGREVFDVSGAGDTVVATIAAALAAGADVASAAALANVTAGIVVGKVGTAAAYAIDVVDALHHQDITHAEAKVLALAPALDRIDRWRRRDLQVGFTNGCFDLLHPGHVSLLSQAKAACDRLVVGLNSDASVRRLDKGPDRPIQSEAARATVLAGLASVDMVVIFNEDTPLALIEAIRPELLVKGADYTLEQVVGADLVQGHGGRVMLAEIEPGHSTSATLARLGK